MSKREAEKQLTKNDVIFSGNSEQDIVDYAKQAPKEVLLQRKIAVPQSRKKRCAQLSSTYSNPFANLSESNRTQASTFSIQPPVSAFSFPDPLKQGKKEDTSFKPLNPVHSSPPLFNEKTKNDYELFLHQRSVNYFFQKAVNVSISKDPFGDLTKICYEYINYREKIDKSNELNSCKYPEDNQSILMQEEPSKNSSSKQSCEFISKTNNSINTSVLAHSNNTPDYKNEMVKNRSFSFVEKHTEENEKNIEEVKDNSHLNKSSFSDFITSTKKNNENILSAFETQTANDKSIFQTSFTFENTNNFSKAPIEKKIQDQSNTKDSSNTETKTISASLTTNTPGFSAFSNISESKSPIVNENIDLNPINFSFITETNKTEQIPFSFEVKSNEVIDKPTINVDNSKNLFSFTSAPKIETNTSGNTNSTPIFSFGSTTKNTSSSNFSWTPDKGIKFAASPSKNVSNTMDKPPIFQFMNPLSTRNLNNEDISQHKSNESIGFEFGSKTNTGFSFGQSSTINSAFADFQQKNTSASETVDDNMFPQEPRTNDHLIAGKGEGEENEDVIFTAKAKIYKYIIKENRFSDLGIGILKLNVDKDTLRARVLARLEGSGKVILNVGLQKDFQYLTTGKKSVKIPAIPKEGMGIDTYLVRVRDEETSKELADLLESKKLAKQTN
ncbi:hypothetical protein PMAC_003048 [Pneumocystis sp. 'macacae']|nr:hypothetical protein PMAC_003048 [Pneumocystis sp. 'macacae']